VVLQDADEGGVVETTICDPDRSVRGLLHDKTNVPAGQLIVPYKRMATKILPVLSSKICYRISVRVVESSAGGLDGVPLLESDLFAVDRKCSVLSSSCQV
jgi:hypothetical protein